MRAQVDAGGWMLVIGGALLACAEPSAPRREAARVNTVLASNAAEHESAPTSAAPVPAAAPEPKIREPRVDCQVIDETGFRRGRKFPIKVVTIDRDLVERRTANAYWAMRKAAADDGIELIIYSGFRTIAEQRYFYRCFRKCACNGCSPAAKPGFSNHQSGRALDLALGPGVRDWLVANARRFGFRATVKSEPWHWEYRPGRNRKKRNWPPLCPRENGNDPTRG